jgi:hypothetical protein
MMETTSEIYLAAVDADNRFQANLVRQFGDPSSWGQDYRYDVAQRHLWEASTWVSFWRKRAADNRIPPALQPEWRGGSNA